MTGDIPVVLLFGPTASGKTRLLGDLFLCPGSGLPRAEIVSADSMQVYRGMDIGTAKPDPAFLSSIPHHLVDIRNPDEQFNSGDFVECADSACSAITLKGSLPVVSGGTAFYLKNFMFGISEAPPSDPAIRAAVQADLKALGRESLRAELAERDPAAFARIHENDEYRLTRALEVIRLTGKPLSSFAIGTKPRPGYRFLILALERDREALGKRIDIRVTEMFHAGLRQEFLGLREAGYGHEDPGMQAIGYREFFEADGEGRFDDDTWIISRIALHTKQYAKRQMTFFRSFPDVEWIDPDDAESARRKIADFLSSE